MTANYRDSTSYVSTSSLANDYTSMKNYSKTGFQSVPVGSLMKLSVSQGGERYFSAAPSFEARLDNYRIAPPSKTPISIGDDGAGNTSSGSMLSVEGSAPISNGDYYTLNSGAYKLNPQ